MRPNRLRAAVTVGVVALGLLAPTGAASAVPSATPRAAAGGPSGAAAPSAVPTALGDELTFVGHGWGHGRGMGQWGALGYAVNYGWTYRQILDHYYGGTVAFTDIPNFNPVAVELEALTGTELRAIGRGLLVDGAAVGDTSANGRAVRVTQQGSAFLVQLGDSCAGPWTNYKTGATVTVDTASKARYEDLIRVCEANGERGYRGYLTVQRHLVTGSQTTFNQVSLEDYLLGVVPRESPDSWGSAGGGAGMQALKAQAVAARSYAVASSDRPSGARMCDTTACQVYLGATFQGWSQGRTILDGTNANVAVQATAGEIRAKPGTNTAVRTEFSSSTGGWTVPGTFPAVEDLGDAYVGNPNHTWSAKFTYTEVAQKLGLGGVHSVTVTARNGLGDWGGRVTQVAVVDGGGVTRTYTGGNFRSKMGTDRFKSDWFTVSGTSRADAESVVKALYQDLLLRTPDPTGLKGWTDALLTGTSQSVLVGTLTRSTEYIQLRITKAYTEVLGRAPEPAGMAGWTAAIQAGQATVDDVQRRFYDSQEYFTISGGTTDGYIRRLYTTVLRRPAGDAEVADWSAQMAARGRGWVVDAIWFSMEAAKVRAGDYYLVFLGRAPDLEGQTAWAQVLLTYGEGAVRNGIAGSMEYRNRAIARFP
jgi:SpoIID/LytB domain protein